MSFKYINPGYAELLSSGGTTVTGAQYSKTGVAFWQPRDMRGIQLDKVPLELYVKLDMYIEPPEHYGEIEFWGCLNRSFGIQLQSFSVGSWFMSGCAKHQELSIGTDEIPIKTKGINTLWFRLKPGENKDGIFHVIFNGEELCNKQNLNFTFYQNERTLTIYTSNNKLLISSLIISDEKISPREQAIMVPVQATQTDMTDCGDSIYEATAAGQELLQSVDVSSLISRYGGNSRVVSIVPFAKPAYRTAEGLCALTAIEKRGGTTTEHGRHIVTQDQNGFVMGAYDTSLSIADLAGRQFGWRAGT